MGLEARQTIVRGLVQGVGFRHHTKVRARELGIAGWVRNLPDGTVEVWAEGEPPVLDELESWLRIGPPGARVEGLEIALKTPQFQARFVVLRETS